MYSPYPSIQPTHGYKHSSYLATVCVADRGAKDNYLPFWPGLARHVTKSHWQWVSKDSFACQASQKIFLVILFGWNYSYVAVVQELYLLLDTV